MTPITEMTEQEILALTTADLDRLVQLRMAEEGIKLLQAPTEPTYADVPAPDVTVYDVGCLDSVVDDRETALTIAEVIGQGKTHLRSLSYGRDYKTQYLGSGAESAAYQAGEFKAKKVYSWSLWQSVSKTIEDNAKLKETYEKGLKEYRDATNEAAWVREEIYGRFDDVCAKYAKLERLRDTFAEYLKLADGDQETALKFMDKAYSLTEDEKEYVLSGEPTGKMEEVAA
jgi:hypothetical protein